LARGNTIYDPPYFPSFFSFLLFLLNTYIFLFYHLEPDIKIIC
jgi:hypothetical protein